MSSRRLFRKHGGPGAAVAGEWAAPSLRLRPHRRLGFPWGGRRGNRPPTPPWAALPRGHRRVRAGYRPGREGGGRSWEERAPFMVARPHRPQAGRAGCWARPQSDRGGRPCRRSWGPARGRDAHPAARWLGAMPPETRAPPGGGLAWTRGGHSRCSVRLLPGLRKVTCCPLGRVSDRSGELSPRLEAGPALGG